MDHLPIYSDVNETELSNTTQTESLSKKLINNTFHCLFLDGSLSNLCSSQYSTIYFLIFFLLLSDFAKFISMPAISVAIWPTCWTFESNKY